MKRIAALLLVIALLVPTLALAAKSTATPSPAPDPTPEPLPTFDFTVDEWLERYMEVVPEDDPYYFEEFEENDIITWGSNVGLAYNRHLFGSNEENSSVWLLRSPDSEKPIEIWAIAPYSLFFGHPDAEQAFASFSSLCKSCILATNPSLSEDAQVEILKALCLQEWAQIPWGSTALFQHANIRYSCNFEGPDRVRLTIEPFNEQ